MVLRILHNSSVDDQLKRPRERQGRRDESTGKTIWFVAFCRRNAVKLLAAGLLTLVLSVLALAPGIGFSATIKVSSTQAITRGVGHPGSSAFPRNHGQGGSPNPYCDYRTIINRAVLKLRIRSYSSGHCIEGFAHDGILNIYFNPILYPVSHLLSSSTSANFTRQDKNWMTEATLKENLTQEKALSELLINIPLYAAMGLALGTVSERIIRKEMQADSGAFKRFDS